MTPIDLPSGDERPHEERIASRRGWDGHLLHVRVDQVRLPSGRESVREMIEHPGSVVVVPVTVDGEVLLIRQYRYAVGETLIELPAGLIDEGESAEIAARRELIEETGHEAEELTCLGGAYVSPGYTRELSRFFVATGCIEAESHTPDPDEPIELIRVPLTDLPGLLEPGNSPIRNAQALLALNWFLRLRDDLAG